MDKGLPDDAMWPCVNKNENVDENKNVKLR